MLNVPRGTMKTEVIMVLLKVKCELQNIIFTLFTVPHLSLFAVRYGELDCTSDTMETEKNNFDRWMGHYL
jgi:hypothetical protein